MNRTKVIGAIVGLFAAIAGVLLVTLGQTQAVQPYQAPLGLLIGAVVVASGWIVTRKWVVPTVLTIAILGIVGSHFVKSTLDTNGSNQVVILSIVALIIDVVVFAALIVALFLYIAGVRKWFKT
jgi:hypothetical protein